MALRTSIVVRGLRPRRTGARGKSRRRLRDPSILRARSRAARTRTATARRRRVESQRATQSATPSRFSVLGHDPERRARSSRADQASSFPASDLWRTQVRESIGSRRLLRSRRASERGDRARRPRREARREGWRRSRVDRSGVSDSGSELVGDPNSLNRRSRHRLRPGARRAAWEMHPRRCARRKDSAADDHSWNEAEQLADRSRDCARRDRPSRTPRELTPEISSRAPVPARR